MWTGWTQVHPRLTFFLWWDFLLGNAAKWSCLSEYNQGLWQGLLNLWTRWNMQIKFQYSIEKWISVQLEQVSILENESLSVVFNSLRPHGLYSPWNSLDQNIGVGSLSLLQRIFRTLWLNQGLPHGRQIFYQLSHQESPRILEWVAYSFSSGSLALLFQIFLPMTLKKIQKVFSSLLWIKEPLTR